MKKTLNLQCFHSYSILQVFAESHLARHTQMYPIKYTCGLFFAAIYTAREAVRSSSVCFTSGTGEFNGTFSRAAYRSMAYIDSSPAEHSASPPRATSGK